MPLGLDTANLGWLESPSKSQKASELSLSAEALILGLVLEFDLLTESVWAGWSRGAKLLQGLILSPYLTENSCCNPPLALSASSQEGTSRPLCKDRTTLGRAQERVPCSGCPQVIWLVLCNPLAPSASSQRGCCFDWPQSSEGLWSPLFRLDSSSSTKQAVIAEFPGAVEPDSQIFARGHRILQTSCPCLHLGAAVL